MEKKKKLNLEQFKVKSFVTSLEKNQGDKMQGGNVQPERTYAWNCTSIIYPPPTPGSSSDYVCGS